MNISEPTVRHSSLLPKYIVLSIITLYSASLFLPVLFRIITPVGNIVLVFVALVCMVLDKHTGFDIKKMAVIKYAFAGLLMLYMWWIGMKEIISLNNYMAHSLLLWASIPFFIYLRSNSSQKSRRVLIAVILACMTITCITTIASISRHPEAPRILAGGGEASRVYSWLNIGGYGFVYSLALITPIILGISFSSYGIWIRLMALVLTGLFGFTILLTQYFVAFYMWLLGTSIIIIYNVINKIAQHILKKSRSIISMALAILIVLAVFAGFIFEINSAASHVFSALNLTYLSERVDNIDELQGDTSIAIMDKQSSVVESSIGELQGDTPIAIMDQQTSVVENSIDIVSGGKMDIQSGTEPNIESGGDLNIVTGGKLNTTPTDSIDIGTSPFSVGGTNLLRDSEAEKSTNRFLSVNVYDILSQYIGQPVTVSFEMLCTVKRPITVYPYQSCGITIADSAAFTVATVNMWHRFTLVTTVVQNPIPTGYSSGSIGFYDFSDTQTYKIRRIKIELGNIATDWSPSPLDTTDALAGNIFVQSSVNQYPSDALGLRLSRYFSVIDGVQEHWLSGNLLSTKYSLSFHSDILDAFLGGGVLGAALVMVLLIVIFRGLFMIPLNAQIRPYFMLLLLMLLGLGFVNTILLSREMIYICFILWAVSMAQPNRENT